VRSTRRSSGPWRLRQPRRPDVAIPVADYHKQAKDAGSKLKAYVLTYASAAAGVYFLALAGGSKDAVLSTMQKWILLVSICFYMATVIVCLVELHIDAKRFYSLAKQMETLPEFRSWDEYSGYKRVRLKLIYASYVTALIATCGSMIYLGTRIF